MYTEFCRNPPVSLQNINPQRSTKPFEAEARLNNI
jgi:hypothetical protein